MRSDKGAIATQFAAGTSMEEIIRHYYLAALSRPPDDGELAAARAFLSQSKNLRQGVEGFVWAVMNFKEFLFNH